MKWMKHDCDANRSPKLERLLMVHGAAGFGLYWLIVELIGDPIDKDNISFELKHNTDVLAYRSKLEESQVKKIIDWMVDETLFERHPTTQAITCLKLAERIDTSLVRNPQLKIIQQQIRNEVLNDSESSGTGGNESGKVLLDVDSDLDSDNKTATATTAGDDSLMELNWFPGQQTVKDLIYHAVDESFIDEYIPGFQRYWIDRGVMKASWDAVFYEQCLGQFNKQLKRK